MNSILEAVYTLLYIVYSYCEALFRLVVPPSPKSVSGQVVLVTGGGKGIGRETALQLASRGATIVLWDVDEASLKCTADDLRAQGKAVHVYVCDVSDPDDVTQTANQVRQDVGDVDILVNNAGIGYCKLFKDLSVTEIRRTIDVNVTAHFWTLKEFLPSMASRNHGHLVTVASAASFYGAAYLVDYTVSKFGARGLLDALERELRGKPGIKLTTVYPGFTDTTMITSHKDRIVPSERVGPLLRPEEVAAAIVDGILRDRREVYVPSNLRISAILMRLLPAKAKQFLLDTLNTGYVPVNKDSTH